MRTLPAQLLAALRAFVVLSVVLGIGYPIVVLGVGQLAFHSAANGSLVSAGGRVVGSDLIGQPFSDAAGTPLERYFQPRPSHAGKGYDATASGGSNRGPENILTTGAATGTAGALPPDAVTASGSGLDPDISPANARLQAQRVAAARGLAVNRVLKLVDEHVQGRILGFMGEPRVNVLALNIALDRLE